MDSHARQLQLVVVSASRSSADAFEVETLLGQSLGQAAHRPLKRRIACGNRQPLARIYNAAIEESDPDSLLIFCHDDLWLGEPSLADPLLAAIQRFDLIGVAGNSRIAPGHSTWWLHPTTGRFDHPHLVGSILHGTPQRASGSRYGPAPAEALLLDGLFLAARAGVLQQAHLRFDPELAFHFYDLDFCRSALAAGLRLGVWPLPLIHASTGNPGSLSWQNCLIAYRRKWGDAAVAVAPAAAPFQPSISSINNPQMSESTPAFEITTSRQVLAWMAEQRLSITFTTDQIDKLFALGLKADDQLAVFERTFHRCLGLCPSADGNGFWMSSLHQIWRFENMLRPGEQADGFDRIYVPQLTITTGDCDIHDMAVDGSDRLVFVNTLFSCLATTSESHSFRPLWRPRFISRLAPEDCCHLNGLAMREGQAAFVSAISASDGAAGWRERRRDGGIVIDVASDEIIASGLSMPHSPRWYRDRLWICNSGSGEFGWIDLDSGRFEPIAFCAGYLRGVAFHGDFALLSTSKPRQGDGFSGLPLAEALIHRNVEPRCSLQVVDLRSGDAVHWIRFEGIVEEIYNVIALPGVRNPSLIGLRNDEIRRLISIEE